MRQTETSAQQQKMEQTEVIKPETLDDLIKTLHKIFESDSINVEEVQSIMEAYESKPHEWMKFAKFDQYRYIWLCIYLRLFIVKVDANNLKKLYTYVYRHHGYFAQLYVVNANSKVC